LSVFFFVFYSMVALAPGRDHAELATAITARALAEPPLFRGDDDRRKTASYLVAVAFREGSLRLDAVGDHGKSFCTYQIHSSSGGTEALTTDADACVGKAFAMLRESARMCPEHPLAFYASGPGACSNKRAQRISRDRLGLASRLAKSVQP